MSELIPYMEGALSRDSRRAGRAISRHQAGSQVRQARFEMETDDTLVKLDALTTATGAAMGCVVRVAQAQRQAELMAPEASGRLAFLADEHAFGMNESLVALRCGLRRR